MLFSVLCHADRSILYPLMSALSMSEDMVYACQCCKNGIGICQLHSGGYVLLSLFPLPSSLATITSILPLANSAKVTRSTSIPDEPGVAFQVQSSISPSAIMVLDTRIYSEVAKQEFKFSPFCPAFAYHQPFWYCAIVRDVEENFC